ncbi:hypothetical protein [Leptolyngbya ohadii]|uniref:hypothetical protein n=1 Tax=Leptolyngbya ohadii TaxID=1962290 RepID=UPI000B59E009|nr:hypothetical protein [Leptolyngbya ohadii]
MARYTSLFTVSVSFDQPEWRTASNRLRHSLSEMLRSCSLDVIYDSEDYLVAKEMPGRVSYAQLVTVEVLIEKPVQDPAVRMNFVVKNEELPLKSNNHCRAIFDSVNRAIAENRQWLLIESAVS